MTRSVRASKTGLEKAQQAFKLKGCTKEYLAGGAGCSRQTIHKFLKGQSVDKSLFQAICTELGLEWGEIAELEAGEEQAGKTYSINALLQEVREKIKPYIQERCSTMRVLDMTQPVELNDIYTDVNILEQITGRRRLKIEDLQAELLQNSDLEELVRFGLCVTQKRVSGLQAVQGHRKLMVLGKPGAGKTTFLKYLAIQCIERNFQGNRFPIFITLKDFAEADKKLDIFEYIALQLSKCQVTDASTKAEQLLEHGKVLVLLDGLDEVREEDTKRVLNEVQEFSYQFHTNQFVITCRIAAKEYTFQGFTEVEVADFNSEQIATFAQNWFRLSDPVKGERFMQKLKGNKPIEELATNPLLLTLLCLVFGEAGSFPTNRSELYKEGLDVLLKKWDAKRNIERDEVYKKLSLQRKEDLLSQIALTTFEHKDYFFKQKTIEKYIADFIFNLPNARTEPKQLELDSEAILKSIEAQHGLLVARATGIYSFSHLTFHEYFAAREIKERSLTANLVKHITEKRWREVFLLAAGMMRNADDLVQLMKQKVDGLLATDEKLQQFLTWVEEKSCSVKVGYKTAAVRAFYVYLGRDFVLVLASDLTGALDLALARDRDCDFVLVLASVSARGRDRDFALASDLASDLALALASTRDLASDLASDLVHVLSLASTRDLALALASTLPSTLAHDLDLDLELKHKLQQFQDQLPNPTYDDQEASKAWWQENGQAWTEQLRAVMIEHCNIGHDWQFSDSQKKLLEQYYDANKLLVDCLNSECYVSRDVRQHIEDTLLLPVKTSP
ncbi:MAG: NACHT C-terminal helical domain 2-containing protein [Nostoc sp. EkiNYC01]|nr:NACHT domain-containing NTPase [Nostoc sp. EkiNYC01]